MKLYPESSMLTSVHIPDFFEPKQLSTVDGSLRRGEHYDFVPDETGRTSIIRFTVVPYIDISRYDFERKDWYLKDQYNGKWRFFRRGQYKPHSDSIHSSSIPVFVSMDGMYNGEEKTVFDLQSDGFRLGLDRPITIRANSVRFTDITDYSGDRNISPTLNELPNTLFRQFYYDKKFSLYTNQELNDFEDDNLQIIIKTNIDKVNVKCRMGTNATGLSPYTPYVDYYIIKLTGQNL